MSESKSTPVIRRRHSQSLFGPIFLIAGGVLLLLYNLGTLPRLNWAAALQLWPLLLVFIGLNIIVRMVPRPFGSFLSALVGLVAVLTFGYVLLYADRIPALRDRAPSTTLQEEVISYSADGVDSAVIHLNLHSPGARLFALEDSADLIRGDVNYFGRLVFDATATNGRATVNLDTTGITGGDPFFWINPATWLDLDRPRWEIGLNPTVPTDLRLNLASGSVDLNLAGLTLTGLTIDGASGSSNLVMAAGEYDVTYDVASGSVRIAVPDSGRYHMDVEGGSGSLVITIPREMAARITVEGGSGSFNIDRRFRQIEGSERDEGVWVTDNFEDAANRVDIRLDVASGSVNIREP